MASGQTANNQFLLTEGNIIRKLRLVALPIIGSQVIQMTYNLADMFWLGKVGSGAVAASGTVGMYLWLSMAFMMYGRMGAEIGVSQNLGRGEPQRARVFGEAAFTLSAVLGVLFAAVMILFREPLVGFFHIQELDVVAYAEDYLAVVSIGTPFVFITSAVTGAFTGSGNSRLPFFINCVGLGLNMALDPLLIFYFDLGVVGAAWATIIAQIVAAVLNVLALLFHQKRPFPAFRLFVWPQKAVLKQMFQWGTPVAVESFLFTFLSMLLSRMVAAFGAGAIAAQRISIQIESLSWLIAGGFGSALTAFVGQNFGAGKWPRIHRGFQLSSLAMTIWGAVVSLILFFGARPLMTVFIPNEPDVVALGIIALRIISFFQIIGCLESVAAGAFRGLGKTIPPSLVSVISNALRVVAAYFLSQTALGVAGVWWGMAGGMALRGGWMFLWYLKMARRLPRQETVPGPEADAAAR